VTPEEATALFQMRCNWGESYRINFVDDVWTARRYNNFVDVVLAADTAEELNWLIRTDYGRWLQEPAES
jgi:hypothetical protein